MSDDAHWEESLLSGAAYSVSTVVLGLLMYCLKNKLKHSKVKCMSGCCEYSAQEDSLRRETTRLEDFVSVLQERIKFLERKSERHARKKEDIENPQHMDGSREEGEESKQGNIV